MSGYDIKKIIDIGLSHFWNENYGQIYPTLDKLVKDGLATKSVERLHGKRARNLYEITPNGLQVFRDWLALPADPPLVRNELQLKFFLSGKLPPQISLHMISLYREQQREILDEYLESEINLRRGIETGEYPLEVQEIFDGHKPPLNASEKAKQCQIFLLSLRHGILAIQARLVWCDEVNLQLSK